MLDHNGHYMIQFYFIVTLLLIVRGPVNAQLCVIDALEADFDALQILE